MPVGIRSGRRSLRPRFRDHRVGCVAAPRALPQVLRPGRLPADRDVPEPGHRRPRTGTQPDRSSHGPARPPNGSLRLPASPAGRHAVEVTVEPLRAPPACPARVGFQTVEERVGPHPPVLFPGRSFRKIRSHRRSFMRIPPMRGLDVFRAIGSDRHRSPFCCYVAVTSCDGGRRTDVVSRGAGCFSTFVRVRRHRRRIEGVVSGRVYRDGRAAAVSGFPNPGASGGHPCRWTDVNS